MGLFEIHKLKIWVILLCMVLSVRAISLPVRAEEEKRLSDIVEFTDIALWYTDEGGALEKAVEDRGLIEKDAKLALRYTYKIPEGKTESIEADTAYYLEVSPHLALPDLGGGSPLTVKTDEGSVEFGKICADGTRAWITFTAKEDGSGTVLSDIGELSGAFFYLQCSRAEEPPENASLVEGEENLYALKYENNKELLFGYAENELSEAKAKIVKNGSQKERFIVWTIRYTPWQNPAEDAGVTPDTPFELRDTIDGALHSYVAGSVEIAGLSVAEYTSRDEIPADAESYVVVEEMESGAVLSIGGKKLCAGKAPVGKPAEPLEITYTTVLREELFLPGAAGVSKVSNTAELFAGEDGMFHSLGINGKYELIPKSPVWIEKKGTTTRHADGTGSATDWTITFFTNGFDFTKDNALTLHDQLPEGSTLTENSLRVDGVSVPVEKTENNGFTVSSIETAKQSVSVSYQTTVPEEMYDSGTDLGENTAWFTFRYQNANYETPKARTPVGSGDGSGKPGTAVVVKENSGYQAESRCVEWTVKINPHRAYLQGATFTDDLGSTGGICSIDGHAGGLELAGNGMDDITVLLDDVPIADSDRDLVSLEYAGQVLTVTVGKIGARTVTLKYTTKVCDPCVFANNTGKETFVNRISTADMIIGANSTEKRSASAQSTVDVSAAVLSKRAPVYDYAAGTMKWTVEIDGAGLSMKDVVLTDALPAGLTYVDGTFQTDPVLPDARLTATGQNLTMDLGEVREKTLVMFETKVDPEKAGFNSDENVVMENTAFMKGEADGVEFAEVSHRVEHSFVNHGLLKRSKTDHVNEWIDYEVLINPFGLSLPQTPTLVDTLDRRLQLDEDTLRFYEASVTGTSGNADQRPDYTKTGEGLPLEIADYDPETNSFTVRLPIAEKSKNAYVLAYRADIIERQAGSYGNSVRFEGGSVRLGGVKQNSAPVSGGGGGGGGVASRRVSITVTQTDSSTKLPLVGVTYTLYQWDEKNGRRGMAVARGTTDVQGKVSFKVKPGMTYELVETEGISGYDAVPEWENLPEGVIKGTDGFLISAEAAGQEKKLELTKKVSEPVDPEVPGDSGDSGDSGDGNHTDNSGSNGEEDNMGNSGSGEDSDHTGGTMGDGDAVDTGNNDHPDGGENNAGGTGSGVADSKEVKNGQDALENPAEDMLSTGMNTGLTDQDDSDSGRKVESPKTGDDAVWLWRSALFSGIVLAVMAAHLYRMKKRRKGM